MKTVETETIGEAWLATARHILREGADAVYDGEPRRELALLTVHVAAPDPDDPTIARLADPDWLDWMRRNFTEPDDVPELGGARSYARRLRDYGGRDQGTSSSWRACNTRWLPRPAARSDRSSSTPSPPTSTSRSSP